MATSELKVAGGTTAPEAQARGFGAMRCPGCGEEALFTLDLDDADRLTCAECSTAWTLEEMAEEVVSRERELARWRKLLAWCRSAPVLEE